MKIEKVPLTDTKGNSPCSPLIGPRCHSIIASSCTFCLAVSEIIVQLRIEECFITVIENLVLLTVYRLRFISISVSVTGIWLMSLDNDRFRLFFRF